MPTTRSAPGRSLRRVPRPGMPRGSTGIQAVPLAHGPSRPIETLLLLISFSRFFVYFSHHMFLRFFSFYFHSCFSNKANTFSSRQTLRSKKNKFANLARTISLSKIARLNYSAFARRSLDTCAFLNTYASVSISLHEIE